MGNNNKNKNQATDEKKNETQAQTVENQQTDAPAATDSGDTQPPVTPPADSGAGDGNGDSTPTDTPPAGKKDGSEEQPEGGGSKPVDESAGGKTKDKKVKLTLRHKSHTQHYYRCGLMLTKVFAEYEVSEEAVAKIKADKWIEIKGSK